MKFIDWFIDTFNIRCFDYPHNCLPYLLEDLGKAVLLIGATLFIMFLLMI